MKLSLRWMRDYAPLDAPLQGVVQALVDTGTEVDEVHREAQGSVVARIVGLAPVPEAQKSPVQMVDIEVGEGNPVRVLSSAPDLRVGDLVPYAPPGVRLPGLDEPIQVRAMFGGKYESPGMLCSAVELGVGEDAEGIMVLDHGVAGQPLHEILDLDAILEVDITPNRPDCLGHVGVARELAAALGESLHEPPADVPEVLLSAAGVEGRLTVKVEDPVGCPRFTARIIEGVAIGPSPTWMQRRLRAIGLRPINNVVDVTNYVANELGQPLHAFDLERFRKAMPEQKGHAEVVVRRARAGEKVLSLEGELRELTPADMAVCAGDRPVSIAGIIGGQDTAVDSGTHNVLLEAASWDGPTIRATSRRLALRTDASSRFEKGLSDVLPPLALERAAALIAELSGGHVLRGMVDEHLGPLPPVAPVVVTIATLEDILGCPVDPNEAATALARLGFAVEQDGSTLTVAPPLWRRDVTIAADVAEEVGRSLGYGRVPSTLPGRRTPVGLPAPTPPLEDRVREVCLGAGFDEAITYSFVAPGAIFRLGGVGENRVPLQLRNPLSEEWSALRTSILPGLCQALALNLRRGVVDLSLFEVGRVFWEGERRVSPLGTIPDGIDDAFPPLPAEPLLLGLVSQSSDTGGDAAAIQLRHLQSVLAWLAQDLAGASLTVEAATVPGLRAQRSGRLRSEGREVGLIGELDASTVEAFELRGRVVAAELRLDAVAPEKPRVPRFRQPPKMPAVIRDLSVVVPEGERMDRAIAAINEAGRPLLAEVEPVGDDYRDERLGAGRKSWTFRLTFRAEADDRTLTGAEAQECLDLIETALRVRCQAEVRR
jgi:phenylalanyl-tRNA synthetase beta chain